MASRMKTAIVCVAAIVSAGCSTMHKARPPDAPLPMWTAQSAIKSEMAEFYPSTLLATLGTEFESARQQAGLPSCPSTNPQDSTCIQRYMHYQDLGFRISGLHCNAYLAAVYRAANYQKFARESTNDLGLKTNAALGLFKSATAAASFVNLGFGFVENIYKNYDAAYFPSNDVLARLNLFRKIRQEMLIKYQADPPKSLAIADARVHNYAESCTPQWMESLVDASVAASAREQNADALLKAVGVVTEAAASSGAPGGETPAGD